MVVEYSCLFLEIISQSLIQNKEYHSLAFLRRFGTISLIHWMCHSQPSTFSKWKIRMVISQLSSTYVLYLSSPDSITLFIIFRTKRYSSHNLSFTSLRPLLIVHTSTQEISNDNLFDALHLYLYSYVFFLIRFSDSPNLLLIDHLEISFSAIIMLYPV